MKIGLIQIDGKIPNLALMKLAKWHNEKGDDVKFIDLSTHKFDRIYGSKIFIGGSGYDLKQELPEEIELQVPDYNKFNLDYSIGFTSRGCIRDCGFCIVKEKEGNFKDINMDWIKTNKVLLIDNNFLASPNWKEKLQYFIDNKIKVSFNQGLDLRLINDEKSKILSEVKYYDFKFTTRRLYFAWDDIKDEEIIIRNLNSLLKYIKPQHIMIYVLVGYNSTFEQDYYRFKKLKDLKVKPFIMLYNNCKDKKLRDFSRYVNKRYYELMKWEDYSPRTQKFNVPKKELKPLPQQVEGV
jgi:hypothetical protein